MKQIIFFMELKNWRKDGASGEDEGERSVAQWREGAALCVDQVQNPHRQYDCGEPEL